MNEDSFKTYYTNKHSHNFLMLTLMLILFLFHNQVLLHTLDYNFQSKIRSCINNLLRTNHMTISVEKLISFSKVFKINGGNRASTEIICLKKKFLIKIICLCNLFQFPVHIFLKQGQLTFTL